MMVSLFARGDNYGIDLEFKRLQREDCLTVFIGLNRPGYSGDSFVRVRQAEFCFLADSGSNPGMVFNVDVFAYRPRLCDNSVSASIHPIRPLQRAHQRT